ncbi:MAG TPA: CHAT domain-containing protein [Pyrinomonadaceae bacterium]
MRHRIFILPLVVVAACNVPLEASGSDQSILRYARAAFDLDDDALMPRAAQGETRQLIPGETVRQEVTGAFVHTFRIQLEAGQYMRVIVEQHGVDVVVSLLGPDNHRLITMDSPNGRRGPESVSVVAQLPGDYFLEVGSDKKWAPAGSYEVKAEVPRAPTQADLSRIAAERAFAEALKLEAEPKKGARQAAAVKYAESLSLWKTLGDRHGEAYTLCALGISYRALGDVSKATTYFEQAQSLWQEAKDKQEESFVLNEMGAAYRQLNDPHKALDYYAQALALRGEIADRWGQAQIYNNIGLIYARMGKHLKAIEFYEDALRLWQAVGDRNYEAYARHNLSGALRELGETQRAFENYQLILGLVRDFGNYSLEAYAHNNMAEIYDAWGDSQKALDEYEAALSLLQKDPDGQAHVLNNLGMIYAAWGDPQRALDYFNRAPEIREQAHDLRVKADTYNHIAYAYSLQNEMKKALENYEEARKLREKARDGQGLAYTLIGMGMAYHSLGEPQKALSYCQQALQLTKETRNLRGQALALDKLGQIYAAMRELPKAFESQTQALSLWRAVGEKQGEAMSLYGIARVERERDHLLQARDKINEAIGIIESLRTRINSKQLRLNYFATKQDFYQLSIDVMMRLHRQYPSEGYDAAALSISERARARGLLDILSESRSGIHAGFDPVLVERRERLKRQLKDKELSLVKLRNVGRTEEIIEEITAVEGQIKALMTECDEVEARMRAKNPSYAALTQPRTLSMQEIQKQLLDDDTVLLEYALGDERSYVWVVTKNGPLFSSPLPGRAEIEKAAGLVRGALTARQIVPGQSESEHLARIREANQRYQQYASDLSDMVLGPIASQLETKRLLIVADGVLRFIPFEALPEPVAQERSIDQTGAGRAARSSSRTPLIKGREIVYEPSALTLALLRELPRAPTAKVVAVLADPVFDSNDERIPIAYRKKREGVESQAKLEDMRRALRSLNNWTDGLRLERLPFSRQEALDIMAVTPAGKGMVALSFNASRETATSPELSKYNIVHIATHALINDEQPELSGIIFSLIDEQGRPQDGFLRLHDIYNLSLNCELVVLSACKTGIGKEVRGEGLLGLTRGFMYAGSARVIASLWAVDDKATAEFMKRFYNQLLKGGKSPSAALSAVKDEMQSERRWRDPYYWAGFVLDGEWK